MKIGVITWFHYENYGTILQAAALQEYLESIDTEPALIEIPFYQIDSRQIRTSFSERVKSCISNKIVEKSFGKYFAAKSKKFHDAIYSRYNVLPIKDSFSKTCNRFDLLICGSDQIWSPYWYNDFYFANFPDITVPKISYAPSIGVKEIPPYLQGTYYSTLKHFNKLSVREESARKEIERITGLSCQTVLDPVFLLDRQHWTKVIGKGKNPQGDYILCYMLDDNMNHWKAIHEFTSKHNMKLVIIPMKSGSYLEKGEHRYDAGPYDFLNLITNAKYVLTDSFHASAFSIIQQKQFYVFERTARTDANSQNSRIYNLLEISGLNDRIQKFNNKHIHEANDIDYQKVNIRMTPLIKQSKKYLNDAIKDVSVALLNVVSDKTTISKQDITDQFG